MRIVITVQNARMFIFYHTAVLMKGMNIPMENSAKSGAPVMLITVMDI